MNSLETFYQLNEILTLLVLSALTGFHFFQPVPGTNWEIA